MGAPGPIAALAGSLGAEQARELAKALYENVESITTELLQNRPDLGYAPSK